MRKEWSKEKNCYVYIAETGLCSFGTNRNHDNGEAEYVTEDFAREMEEFFRTSPQYAKEREYVAKEKYRIEHHKFEFYWWAMPALPFAIIFTLIYELGMGAIYVEKYGAFTGVLVAVFSAAAYIAGFTVGMSFLFSVWVWITTFFPKSKK